jgi:hypothetical protein
MFQPPLDSFNCRESSAFQLTGEPGPVRQSPSRYVADRNTSLVRTHPFCRKNRNLRGESVGFFGVGRSPVFFLDPAGFPALFLKAHTRTECWTTIKRCPRTLFCLAPGLSFDRSAWYLGRRRAHFVCVDFQLVTPRQEFPLSPLRTIPQLLFNTSHA